MTVGRICYHSPMAWVDFPSRRVRRVAGVIVVWASLVGLVLFELIPYRPRTALGWIALLVAGPPLYLLAAALGEWVLGGRGLPPPPRRWSLGWFGIMAIAVLVAFTVVGVSAWLSLRSSR